ncbi:hypothetical protein AGMMS49938_02230 [Fibrobacterales bacterium]|nr:hypothetical protein AGMMS49938_02230 [Fibrobacterales bacterium]
MLAFCTAEDPSIFSFDLFKIKFSGRLPVNAEYAEPNRYTRAELQANLKYKMERGDTMEVEIYEFEKNITSESFFEKSDSSFKWGRRVFVFHYRHIRELQDSIKNFIRRFPAEDTSEVSSEWKAFSLRNIYPEGNRSIQKDYFFGVPVQFDMLIRTYKDGEWDWVCARSSGEVEKEEWEKFYNDLGKNLLPEDRFSLVKRLPSGVVVAVYGDLDSAKMAEKYYDFMNRVR